ncbi:MAG: hypothetical protein U0529_09335 [Thermoanaerobaculia bacterium]
MSALRTSATLLLGAALLAGPSAAQTKRKPKAAPGKTPAAKEIVPPATPANATITALQDRRSSGSFARFTLGMELPDVPAPEAKAARVVVTKAVDDLGTNLVPEGAANARLEPTQRGQLGPSDGKPSPPTIVFAEMKNPPRKAKVLKEVAGEIELFVPSRDPNGEASLPRFLELAGQPVAHAALKANGVELEILSKAQLAAERKKAEDAARAKLRKNGVTDAESLKEMVEGELYSFPKGEEGEVVLRVKDPKKAIQEIQAADAAGNPVFSGKSESAGLTTLSFWNEKPKPDWTLKVRMQSARSLVRYTFSFRDLPLP